MVPLQRDRFDYGSAEKMSDVRCHAARRVLAVLHLAEREQQQLIAARRKRLANQDTAKKTKAPNEELAQALADFRTDQIQEKKKIEDSLDHIGCSMGPVKAIEVSCSHEQAASRYN